MNYTYTAIIIDPFVFGLGRTFTARFPALPGLICAAGTRDKLTDMMREGLSLHLSAMAADGDPFPEENPDDFIRLERDESLHSVSVDIR